MIMSNQLLIAIAIVAWGIAPLFAKVATSNIDPVMVSVVQTGLYIFLAPVSVWLLKPNTHINMVGSVAALAAGLIAALGSLAYLYALKKGQAGIVAACTSIYPVVTLMLSMVFMGEGFSVRKGIGIALTLCGVAVLALK